MVTYVDGVRVGKKHNAGLPDGLTRRNRRASTKSKAARLQQRLRRQKQR
jgi:hypothetical protein